MSASFASQFYENRNLLTKWENIRNTKEIMNLNEWASAVNTTNEYLRNLILHVHTYQPLFTTSHYTSSKSYAPSSLFAATEVLAGMEMSLISCEEKYIRPPTLNEWCKSLNDSSLQNLYDKLIAGHRALNELASLSTPLVQRLARRYYKSFSNFHEEELLVAGVHAVQKGFKRAAHQSIKNKKLNETSTLSSPEEMTSSKGVPIAASTWVWAKSGILQFIYAHRSEIRIPSAWWILRSKGRAAESELQVTLNRQPTNEEVANKLGISANRWEKICEYTKSSVSTETPLKGYKVDDESTDTIGDLLPSDEDGNQSQQYAMELHVRKEVMELLNECLFEEETQIVVTKFGLNDGRVKSIEETALTLKLKIEEMKSALHQITMKLRNYELQRTIGRLSVNEREDLKRRGREEVKNYVLQNSPLLQLMKQT